MAHSNYRNWSGPQRHDPDRERNRDRWYTERYGSPYGADFRNPSGAGNPKYFGVPEPAYGYADEGDPSWRGSAGSAGQYGSQSAAGEHRGRGPRGYRRSDDRIREDVCERLTDDDRLDASEIEVTVKDCEVQLSGTVGSREDKRRAESLADQVSGVKDVHNGIRVQERAGATQAGGEAAASETGSRH